ncbi:MAG: ester cyclase [Thermoplasmata archaeon]
MDVNDLIRKWKDAVNEEELDAFAAMYAPDAVLQTALARVEGRQAVKQYEGALFTAFSGVSLKTLSVVTSGDTGAVEWEYSGKHTGELVGAEGTIPPTDRSFRLRGASFLRINPEGLIVEEHRYFDTGSLFKQLGLK